MDLITTDNHPISLGSISRYILHASIKRKPSLPINKSDNTSGEFRLRVKFQPTGELGCKVQEYHRTVKWVYTSTGYILHVSMAYSRPPYSRPHISTFEQILPNVPPRDQLWSSIPTTDQLYLPHINYPDHWSAVPSTDQDSLALTSSPCHWLGVPSTHLESHALTSSP